MLGAGGDDRLGEAIDVDVGPPPLSAIAGLEGNDREDAVRAHELAVSERDHAGFTLGHRLPPLPP